LTRRRRIVDGLPQLVRVSVEPLRRGRCRLHRRTRRDRLDLWPDAWRHRGDALARRHTRAPAKAAPGRPARLRTAVIAASPVPAAVPGPLAAQAGVCRRCRHDRRPRHRDLAAGCRARGDIRVPRRRRDRTGDCRHRRRDHVLTPGQSPGPWPVDVAYASAPAGQVVAFSRDGKIWSAITTVTSPSLQGTVLQERTSPPAYSTC